MIDDQKKKQSNFNASVDFVLHMVLDISRIDFFICIEQRSPTREPMGHMWLFLNDSPWICFSIPLIIKWNKHGRIRKNLFLSAKLIDSARNFCASSRQRGSILELWFFFNLLIRLFLSSLLVYVISPKIWHLTDERLKTTGVKVVFKSKIRILHHNEMEDYIECLVLQCKKYVAHETNGNQVFELWMFIPKWQINESRERRAAMV